MLSFLKHLSWKATINTMCLSSSVGNLSKWHGEGGGAGMSGMEAGEEKSREAMRADATERRRLEELLAVTLQASALFRRSERDRK